MNKSPHCPLLTPSPRLVNFLEVSLDRFLIEIQTVAAPNHLRAAVVFEFLNQFVRKGHWGGKSLLAKLRDELGGCIFMAFDEGKALLEMQPYFTLSGQVDSMKRQLMTEK
jgi:hypothetical protein